MKDAALRAGVVTSGPWLAVTADQVDSRHASDAVPRALAALASTPALRLGFERTVGDEVQALTNSPAAVVDAVVRLTRLGGWRIGVGLGSVEEPLPSTTRAARGTAYLAARSAIEGARRRASGIALAVGEVDPAPAPPPAGPASETVGPLPYRGNTIDEAARRADDALVVLRALLGRRTEEGWQAMELLDAGMSNGEAAAALGISASAMSQRTSRAHRDEAASAQRLVVDLLHDALAAVDGGGA